MSFTGVPHLFVHQTEASVVNILAVESAQPKQKAVDFLATSADIILFGKLDTVNTMAPVR